MPRPSRSAEVDRLKPPSKEGAPDWKTIFRSALLCVLVLLSSCGTSEENTSWLGYAQGREFQRAQALRREGRLDEARRLFGNLRRLDPANVAAFREEIELSRNPGDREALREELELLLHDDDDDVMTAAHMALLASLIEDRQRKEDLLERAIALDPQSSIAHAEMAVSLSERREDDAAYESWKRAAAGRAPGPRVFRQLAGMEADRHHETEAIKLYETYLALDPDDVWVLSKLGRMHLGKGAADRAEQSLSRAFELDGQDINIIVNLSLAKIQNGRKAEGLELMLRAERLDPKAPDIQANLGVIYADHFRDYRNAIKHYERYLELGGEEQMRVRSWIEDFKNKLN